LVKVKHTLPGAMVTAPLRDDTGNCTFAGRYW